MCDRLAAGICNLTLISVSESLLLLGMFVQLTPCPSWVWVYDRLHLVPGKDLPVEGSRKGLVSDGSLRRPEGDGRVAIPRPAKRDFLLYTYL